MRPLTAEALFFEQDRPILTDPMHQLTAACRAAWRNLANYLGVPVAPKKQGVQRAQSVHRDPNSRVPNVRANFMNTRTGFTRYSRPVAQRPEVSPEVRSVLLGASMQADLGKIPEVQTLDAIVPKPVRQNKQAKGYVEAVEKTRVAYFNFKAREAENDNELSGAKPITKPRLVYAANNNGLPILALRRV